MAAVGMGGGTAWVQLDRGEREALTLETVKLATELGVDINAANTDGRTVLGHAEGLALILVLLVLEIPLLDVVGDDPGLLGLLEDHAGGRRFILLND